MIITNFADELAAKIKEDFNHALAYLQSQCLEKLPLSPDQPGTSVNHLLSMIDWLCNVFLRRILNLAKHYANAINQEEVLAASLMGRAIIETAAHFHHYLNETERYLQNKNFEQVYYLAASHMLWGKHDFYDRGVKLKKLHISDSLRAIDKIYKGIEENHGWLSEFVHPNSLGTTLGFSRINTDKNSVRLFEKIPVITSTPMMDAGNWFPIFMFDWQRLPGIKEKIKNEWIPSGKILELFEEES